jgi:hypothetical protein
MQVLKGIGALLVFAFFMFMAHKEAMYQNARDKERREKRNKDKGVA